MFKFILACIAIVLYGIGVAQYPIYSVPFIVLAILFMPNLGWSMGQRYRAGIAFFILCLAVQSVVLWKLSDLMGFFIWIEQHIRSWGYGWIIDRLNDIYTAIISIPGNQDVAEQFVFVCAINLLGFFLYVFGIRFLGAIVLNFTALVGWLVSLFSRKPAEDEAPAEKPEDSWLDLWLKRQRRGAQCWIHISCGVVSIVLFGLLPFWVLLSPDYLDTLSNGASVLWIGPLILVLEGFRNALYSDEYGFVETIKGWFVSVKPVVHPIKPAFERFRSAYAGPALTYEIEPLKQESKTPVEAESTRNEDFEKLQSDVDGFGVPGEDYNFITMQETLTNAHFDMMTQLLQRHAFDAGGSAWIICPDHSVAECEEHFRRASVASGTRFLQDWKSLRKARNELRAVDVLIGSIEDFEREITQTPENFEDNLSRLSAVFILQLDQIDTGMLKIMGARMRTRLRSFQQMRDNLLLFVQSEHQKRTEDRIEQLFITISGANRKKQLEPVHVDSRIHRYFVIWQHTNELLEKFKKNIDHAEDMQRAMPSAMIETWRVNTEYDCYAADPEGLFHSDYWNNQLVRETREHRVGDPDEKMNIPGKFAALRSFRVVPPLCKTPIAFVEDHGNLSTAMNLGVRGYRVPEIMTHVVQANYPFANVIRSHLAQRFSTRGKDQQDTFRLTADLSRYFAAVAPKPTGGVTELALTIAAELEANRDEGGVSQSRIERFFRVVNVDENITKPLGISRSRAGLIRLFELVYGERPDIMAERAENFENYYNIEHSRLRTGLPFLSVISNTDTTRDYDDGAIVPKADFGLSFDVDTHIRRRGAQYRVISVDVDQNELHDETSNVGSDFDQRFVFERGYALAAFDKHILSQDPLDEAVARISRRNFAIERSKVHQPDVTACEMNLTHIVAERRTFNSWSIPLFHIDSPIKDSSKMNAEGFSPRLLRNALHLRFSSTQIERGSAEEMRNVALALCTSLQDTLALVYPRHAHRIAVLSPEMLGLHGIVEQERREGGSRAAEFALFRQPFLSVSEGYRDAQILPGNSTLHGQMRQAYRFLFDRISERARAQRRDNSRLTSPLLDVMVIEDSDHDLGVARAAFENFADDVRGPWLALLQHMVDVKSAKGEYYAFGEDQFPEVYDFAGALEIASTAWSG